jgi:hypothetical protein
MQVGKRWMNTMILGRRHDPACLFVDTSTPEGEATGLVRDSVVSCLLLATVDISTVAQVLGTLSPSMTRRLDDCLRASLGIP